ncbi:hypothetical protein FQZ97_1007410 [compost metagenome]
MQHAAAVELDHPELGIATFCGITTDRLLGGVAGGKQQPLQRRTRLTEGDAVDHACETELQFAAPLRAAGHREADDVRGREAGCGGNLGAGPTHAPKAAIGTKRQIAHAHLAEGAPCNFSGCGCWVKDLDAISKGHVDEACFRLDGQRVRHRRLCRSLNALHHRA